MLACCPEVWGNLVILTLRSIHLRPLHRGNGQPAAMGKGGSLGLHTLAQDPRGLDCGRQKPAHSRLWLWSSPPPPTSSWLGSREALSQERTIQPADRAGRREGHRTLLPAAFHCLIGSDCSPQPQVLFLRINISTGLMTQSAPGQLALACIWSRFLCCHIPIVLDCSLPQIRGWLHCPNPTTTPRCLFVG